KTENGTNVISPATVVGSGGPQADVSPHVAALNDGGFVVAWRENNNANGTSTDIHASVYDQNGNVVNGNILVNQFNPGNPFSFDVTALPDGGFAVAWEEIAGRGADRVQHFDEAGHLVGTPVAISQESDVNAATLADGRSIFTITQPSGNFSS